MTTSSAPSDENFVKMTIFSSQCWESSAIDTIWQKELTQSIQFTLAYKTTFLEGNFRDALEPHYSDVIMSAIASQITSLTIVYSTVYLDADQRKHQSSASLAFVRGIHLGAVNSPHKWPVTRKMFPFDDVIMISPAFFHRRCDTSTDCISDCATDV